MTGAWGLQSCIVPQSSLRARLQCKCSAQSRADTCNCSDWQGSRRARLLCLCQVGQHPIQPHTLLPLEPVPFTVSVGYHQAQRGMAAPKLPDGVLPPQVFERVPVQPRDAREASDVFYKQNIGDVLLNYENEVVLTNEMYGADALPYIVPDNNVNVRRCSRVVTHAEHARHCSP